MNRVWTLGLAVAVALALPACSDDSPAAPTPPTSTAPRFAVQLRPTNEVPPITNADASGSGTTTVTLNVTRDAAQQITAATGDFTVTLTGFPAATTLTGAHIHNGRPGANAGVIVNLALGAGEFVLASGAVTFSKNGINVDPVVAQNMINDPDGFYFNVHTTLNTGGAVRGQLVKQ